MERAGRRVFVRNEGPAARNLDALDPKRVLLILAHPDDEIFCSGLVCACKAREAWVGLSCMTGGEGGATGGHPRTELGEIRMDELRASARRLGIDSVEFLGYEDPVATEYRTFAPPHDPRKLRGQLRDAIRNARPDTVVTHGSDGEYWHVAHFVLHDAVREALRSREFKSIRFLTMNAWREDHPLPKSLNRRDLPGVILSRDVTGSHRDRRLAALRSHATQAGYFKGLMDGELEAFIDATAVECYRVW